MIDTTSNTDAASNQLKPDAPEFVSNGIKQEDVEAENSGSDEYEDSEDDDDDDDIHVHIGDVNPSSSTTSGQFGSPAVNWKKTDQSAIQKPATAVPAPGTVGAVVGSSQKKIDLNAVGLINGQPIYEFDMETHDEKPWRKPGADITDYFNYGFTEDTWKLYCDKHRRTRSEYHRENNYHQQQHHQNHQNNNPPPVVMQQQQTIVNNTLQPQTLEYEILPNGQIRYKAGPPPDRKPAGSIQVLGDQDVRRKEKENELLALALGQPGGGQRLPVPNPPFPHQVQQRPIYQTLPNGTVVMVNQMMAPPGQFMQHPPPSMNQPPPTNNLQPDGQPIDQKPVITSQGVATPPTSETTIDSVGQPQPQSIQTMPNQPHMNPPIQLPPGANPQQLGLQPSNIQLPPGLQMAPGHPFPFDPNMPPGMQLIPGQPIFQGQPGVDFQNPLGPDQHNFLFPGPPPSFGDGAGSDYEGSDGEGEHRRHRSRRSGESRHRRHRDKSERSERSSKKDHKSDRDRSSRRRSGETSSHSSSHSDRKKSSRSSRGEEADSGSSSRKSSRSSRSSKRDKSSSKDNRSDDRGEDRGGEDQHHDEHEDGDGREIKQEPQET